MKRIIAVLIIVFMSGNAYCINSIGKQDSFLFEIHFQENFNQDTIGCEINDCPIFANKKIISDSILGTTMLIIRGVNAEKKLSMIYDGKRILCTLNSSTILKIVITINHMEQTIVVDLAKGKYIGLSKKFDKEILLIQQNHQFEYD